MKRPDLVQELKRLSRLVYRERKYAQIKILTTSGRVILAQDITLAQKAPGGMYFKYAPVGWHRWESLWLSEVQRLEYQTTRPAATA